MIIKSYEIKKNLKENVSIYLFYGPNNGLIEDLINEDLKPIFSKNLYNYEEIEIKIGALKEQIKQTDSLTDCEAIQGRIVRLSSGVAVINVGGTTEVEMTERKHRIEDALGLI